MAAGLPFRTVLTPPSLSPGPPFPPGLDAQTRGLVKECGSYVTLNKSHHISQLPSPHVEKRMGSSAPLQAGTAGDKVGLSPGWPGEEGQSSWTWRTGREASSALDPSSGVGPATAGWESTSGLQLEAGACGFEDRVLLAMGKLPGGLCTDSQPARSHHGRPSVTLPSHDPIRPPSARPDTMGPEGHYVSPLVSLISLNSSKKRDVAPP